MTTAHLNNLVLNVFKELKVVFQGLLLFLLIMQLKIMNNILKFPNFQINHINVVIRLILINLDFLLKIKRKADQK